jgi:alpha-tubulin suppressor-like RCC1 family protein
VVRDRFGRQSGVAVLGALLACLIFTASAQAAGDTGKAFGYNGSGQLGDGNSPTSSPVPVDISGLSNVTQISQGVGDHALALLSDGTVVAWGANYGGQLGDGTTDDSDTPVAASGITNAVAIATGNAHSLALLADGTVVAWGRNYAGQLGQADTGPETCSVGPCSTVPVPVAGLTGVVAIAAGGSHNLALLSDGTVMAWGANGSGELGNGDDSGPSTCGFSTCNPTPTAVPGLTDVADIAAGDSHSLAILSDGTLMGWGSNGYGETGKGSTSTDEESPVAMPDVSGVTDIAAGSGHSFALLDNGAILGWGDDEFGEVGNGAIGGGSCQCVKVPAVVGTIFNATSIASGAYTGLALLDNGTIKGWGDDNGGQLGDNDPGGSKPSPVNVSGITNATALGAGYSTNYALVGPTQTLTISLTGAGDGKVVGSGISCPGVCSHTYPPGATVILRGLPAPSTSFAFGGACDGTDPCQLTLDQDRTVNAQFGPPKPGSNPSPGPTSPADSAGPTGRRAAALKKCKKVRSHRKHKRCVKRAKRLPE